jgi:hypothetical protein
VRINIMQARKDSDMTKPKNMTPEQEAAWVEKERARRASPEYKAKAAIRARRFYEKPGQKEKIVAKTREFRETNGGKRHRNALERARLASSEKLQAKAAERQRRWQATEDGKIKNRAKSARYADRQREYEHFLSTLEQEGAEC